MSSTLATPSTRRAFSVSIFCRHAGAILLVRHRRLGTWLPVGGEIEPGETPLEAARRELREETGLEAAELTYLTTIFTTPGFTDEQIRLYMASGLTAGETNFDADEFVEPVHLTLSDALARVKSGEITDAKTICTLLFAAGFMLD
jgi:ADP-ribose pyrophosphatase